MLAYAVLVLALVTSVALRNHAPTGLRHGLLTAVLVQVGLGIATLLAHVPVALGTLHQAGAVIVLGVAVALWNDQSLKAYD
jgi:cytochrome c oxidase assembly protein subunit 15